MKLKNITLAIAVIVALTSCNLKPHKEIQLIVRGDDMGYCEASNIACIDAYKNGIMTSVEVLVPGPKFYEAAELLRENSGLDVGVHLCLTSEWDNYEWGPLTGGKSLVNNKGDFPDTTEELFAMELNESEVKAELKAQIDTALKYIPQVSHISSHMFWPESHPLLRKIFSQLSTEYNLPQSPKGAKFNTFWSVEPEEKENVLVDYLKNINDSSINIFVMHPAYNNEETQSIEGDGMDPNVRMAEHRQAVTEAIVSPKMKEIVKQRKIKLISYAEAFKEISK